jgi:HTH-type transcriptional regulator/antitoxin HipB
VKTIATKRHKRLIELLIAERKARGLLQDGLAHALRVRQDWISRIERGDRRIDVIEFLALAEIMGFDPHDVLSQVQAVPPERPPRAIPEPRPRKARRRRGHRHSRAAP